MESKFCYIFSLQKRKKQLQKLQQIALQIWFKRGLKKQSVFEGKRLI